MIPHPESVITPFGDGDILGCPFTVASEVPVMLYHAPHGQNRLRYVDYRDFVRYDDIYNITVFFDLAGEPLRSYCLFDYGWMVRWQAVRPIGETKPDGTRYALGTLSGDWESYPVRPFESRFILARAGVNRELPNAAHQPVSLAEGESIEAWLTAYRRTLTSATTGLELHALLEQRDNAEGKIVWWDLLLRDGWHREQVQRVPSPAAPGSHESYDHSA